MAQVTSQLIDASCFNSASIDCPECQLDSHEFFGVIKLCPHNFEV